MKKKSVLLAAIALGVAVLASSTAGATTPSQRSPLDSSITKAHSVRVCDDDGDCWWTYRHRGYTDHDRHHRWRYGDDDYYGRAPRYRDRDDDDYRDRYGRADRDRDRTARDEPTTDDKDKDYRNERKEPDAKDKD